MNEKLYKHRDEILVSSMEELKELVENIQENVVLSVLIDVEDHYD